MHSDRFQTSNIAPHDLRPPSNLVFIVEKALGITRPLIAKPGWKVGANREERCLKFGIHSSAYSP